MNNMIGNFINGDADCVILRVMYNIKLNYKN